MILHNLGTFTLRDPFCENAFEPDYNIPKRFRMFVVISKKVVYVFGDVFSFEIFRNFTLRSYYIKLSMIITAGTV